MKPRIILLALFTLAVRLFGADNSCGSKDSLDLWIQCRLEAVKPNVITSVIAKDTQQSATKQTDGPAISTSSTSLVDHTSLADFATGALNLTGVGGENSSSSPAGTTTVSAYALYTAITLQNPLDPEIYDANAGWRQLSFSVGTGTSPAPKGTSSGTTATTSSTNTSRVVRATFLILNSRDLATSQNRKTITQLAGSAAQIATDVSRCKASIVGILLAAYQNKPALNLDQRISWENQIEDLTSAAGKQILQQLAADPVTSARIDAVLAEYAGTFFQQGTEINRAVQKMQNALQFSVSGQASVPDLRTQPSDYRAQLAIEKGWYNNWGLTANASFDYLNSPKAGADTRGGRAATDLQYLVNAAAAKSRGKQPVSFDLSAEGDWFQSFKPSYVGQVKLTIPLTAGIELPLSFSYASSANLLHEASVVGKLGLTFDLGRIAAALTKH